MRTLRGGTVVVVVAGWMVLLAATVALAAPSDDADRSHPAVAGTGAAVALAEQDDCGPDPCLPYDASQDSPCGAQPCESDEAELGPCGPDPCLPHDATADGPCGDQPCESDKRDAGPCGPDPCVPADEDAEGPCGPDPCDEGAGEGGVDQADAAANHDDVPRDLGDEDIAIGDEAEEDPRLGDGDVRALLASGDRLEVASDLKVARDRETFPQHGWSLALAVLLAAALSVTAGARRWRRRPALSDIPDQHRSGDPHE